MRNVSTKVVETIKTHILYAITFFSENRAFLRYVEKYCTDGQATDDNMAHARCLLDT